MHTNTPQLKALYTDLGATVLNLCKQVKPMANSYCWLARQKADSHQCQANPRQPILARLPVGVKESPDALRGTEEDTQNQYTTCAGWKPQHPDTVQILLFGYDPLSQSQCCTPSTVYV